MEGRQQINVWLNRIFLPLFKSDCRICSSTLIPPRERVVCSDCLDRIKPYIGPICKSCGIFTTEPLNTCGFCLLQPKPFVRHRSFAQYEAVLKDLILLYKYGGLNVLKEPVTDFYLKMIAMIPAAEFSILIAVPEDPGRKREISPMREIGKVLSRKLALRFEPDLLVKNRVTLPQAGLKRQQRLRNLRGAFSLKVKSGLSARHALLIDDVYTTGSTISECAGELKKAGSKVTALTLAQSP